MNAKDSRFGRQDPSRVGYWMMTAGVRRYWPHDPRPEEIYIDDVAHHLSMECRFTGACKRFYSVAEHCVLVSKLIADAFAFEGLMHDAHEAYTRDMASPTKQSLPDYKAMEAKNWRAMARRFQMAEELPHQVHEADMLAYQIERQQLMPAAPVEWGLGEWTNLPNVGRLGLPPEEAEALFLSRFEELQKARC
jgi:hypothetical protein